MKVTVSKKLMNEQGMTLIEIMVVIVILGILAMAIAPRMIGQTDKAKITRAKSDIAAIETALKLYKLDSGSYPSTEQGLMALVEPPSTGTLPAKYQKGGYLEKGLPKDPWRNPFVYICPGLNGDFDIISYGADGVPDGEDENSDIKNWELDK